MHSPNHCKHLPGRRDSKFPRSVCARSAVRAPRFVIRSDSLWSRGADLRSACVRAKCCRGRPLRFGAVRRCAAICGRVACPAKTAGLNQ
eukprot:12399370-Alexandrium_andersonii.AAC.1